MVSSNFAQYLIAAFGADSQYLEQMLDLFPLGVIITDLEGRVTYYNQAHAKIDNLEPSEVLGCLEIDVLVPITGPNIMKVSRDTAQPILGYVYPYRTFKGQLVNAAYWVYPLFKEDRVIGVICFTQPLLGEFSQGRAYKNPAIQWPGTVPIYLPMKNIVGSSKSFQKAMNLAKINASNPFPVLITGETGSGKEVMAKLIHQASSRRHQPYLAVNCSAIPGSLLEGLLFGTVRGGFTGALDRPGLFESANGGTLYLDEIDSMSLEFQPKLLRAIQEMKVTRVGSSKEIMLDVKLISSISMTPQQALKRGMLRSDLFYRLAVVVVPVPPLRERPGDVELLAEYFICKYNNLLGKSALKLEPTLLRQMKNYSWPGNVRELEHMLTGALAVVQDENVITHEHIPEHYLQAFYGEAEVGKAQVMEPAVETRSTGVLGLAGGPMNGGMMERLHREERELMDYLNRARGNVSQAAKLMGVSRQLFSYRMLKYGLNRLDYK